MRHIIFCYFLIFTAQHSVGQVIDSTKIRMNISKDTIVVKQGDSNMSVYYTLTNISNHNLILYRLLTKSGYAVTTKKERYCEQAKTGAGTIIFLFDRDRKWRSGTHRIGSDYKHPMTKDRADSIIRLNAIKSLENTTAIKATGQKHVCQDIDLVPFGLTKGIYYFQLMYYAGDHISNVADAKQQEEDKKKYSAQVYKGCVISPQSVLLVE